MITHILTNGNAILELEVSDDKDTMTAVFKQTDPNIYDEAEFVVTRNPNDPFGRHHRPVRFHGPTVFPRRWVGIERCPRLSNSIVRSLA